MPSFTPRIKLDMPSGWMAWCFAHGSFCACFVCILHTQFKIHYGGTRRRWFVRVSSTSSVYFSADSWNHGLDFGQNFIMLSLLTKIIKLETHKFLDYRPVICQVFFLISEFQNFFQTPLPLIKRNSHQGKKEVACIVSNPLVSCLWGCGESVNPPKLNIQEVQGALSSRPKGDPGPLPVFSGLFTFVKSVHCN